MKQILTYLIFLFIGVFPAAIASYGVVLFVKSAGDKAFSAGELVGLVIPIAIIVGYPLFAIIKRLKKWRVLITSIVVAGLVFWFAPYLTHISAFVISSKFGIFPVLAYVYVAMEIPTQINRNRLDKENHSKNVSAFD